MSPVPDAQAAPLSNLDVSQKSASLAFRRRASVRGLDRENPKDRIDDRRLADARPAGDHQRLGGQRQTDRCPLTLGELQTAALFDRWQAFSSSIHGKGSPPFTMRISRFAIACSALQRLAKNMQMVSPTLSEISAPSDRSNSRAVRISSFGASSNSSASGINLIRRQPAVTFAHRPRQRVRYPDAQPDHRSLFDAELHRDCAGALETNAPDVPGKPIGVLPPDLGRIG
jgi:hypothetical protein